MNNNGVGFITKGSLSPVLIHSGKAAPWPGIYGKVGYCREQNYSNWTYSGETPIFILYEGLIVWDNQ